MGQSNAGLARLVALVVCRCQQFEQSQLLTAMNAILRSQLMMALFCYLRMLGAKCL